MPIIIGIGLLLSWLWGADIGGLVTAVGVTSIVIGLAVQTAVGPVIAGLLLLFAQPGGSRSRRWSSSRSAARIAVAVAAEGLRPTPSPPWVYTLQGVGMG